MYLTWYICMTLLFNNTVEISEHDILVLECFIEGFCYFQPSSHYAFGHHPFLF